MAREMGLRGRLTACTERFDRRDRACASAQLVRDHGRPVRVVATGDDLTALVMAFAGEVVLVNGVVGRDGRLSLERIRAARTPATMRNCA